ncbi:cryptochrome/photolyase family protein [Marinihelvus fidelis]|uniref:cryptochrome/photolyase family protein n=1 Tax=Marinihelvus fidelis TaxID=2613842 RepID=UPI001CD409C3|nr:deoxyribodipyrimidine photo-lyase [Marinihelvus fidelis]
MTDAPSIVWFRRDLRVNDNPALSRAIAGGGPVLPVYVLADDEDGDWRPGGASRWWLHHALASLADALDELGLPLVLEQGSSIDTLRRLADETNAGQVLWNRRYEPAAIERDARVEAALRDDGLETWTGNAALLWEPDQVSNQSGKPFRVFTPFWKHLRSLPAETPVLLPDSRPRAPDTVPDGLAPEELDLLPKRDWADGFSNRWTPTLNGASDALQAFLDGPVNRYGEQRDIPAEAGTSRLSPYLAHGQLGPRQVWAAVHASGAVDRGVGYKYLSEIAWREFGYHLLVHFPDTPTQALNEKYRAFPWSADEETLQAWQTGLTGYPIVDAGMRELWATGWMHNRVRMVVASLLVKHLLQPWQDGARWFWDTLVDADLASNTLGWQWSAGCGADAAPYFRIFNPMLQGEKFDAEGDYVRRWVPELADLPAKHIHTPWEAPAAVLREAGVRLGETYPEPVIDHKAGRERALAALAQLRNG